MASCARCSVAGAMNRRWTKNREIIEIVYPDKYEIYAQVVPDKYESVTSGSPEVAVFEGKMYSWFMTVFSQEHSKDHDCNAWGKHSVFKLTDGFPRKVNPGNCTFMEFPMKDKELPNG